MMTDGLTVGSRVPASSSKELAAQLLRKQLNSYEEG
jgi:hypothetical protein